MSPPRSLLFFVAVLGVISIGPSAMAQDQGGRFDMNSDVEMDPTVPTPASFLGYEPGERLTIYADLVRYFAALDDASDRVTSTEYARTYEDKPLHYLVITSQENQARIEAIRSGNLRAISPDTSPSEAEALMAEQPVVTWLSYNVHGNEPSSSEAAMQVAYRLAAAKDEETANLLDQAVVIIDPAVNPDGRDRYVNWYRSARSTVLNAHAEDYEHDEPWPQGRTNHYWFDLNRDWVWLVHPESRGRIDVYQRWMPEVHMDYHEQGFNNNYFTMPGQPPRNLNLPAAYDDWAETFGRANAAAFDSNQINYFTRESFDFFYPGYGSSYPSIMGAIGMLSEQGGHSRGGRAVKTNDGYVLTLKQRIFDHFLTSMAVVRTSVENRAKLISYSRAFFSPSTNDNPTKAYLLPDDGGYGYTYGVVDILLKHGVKIERTLGASTIRDAHSYRDGKAVQRRFAPGTFVIRTDQARHILINTLMQRQMEIEDSVMYDMATWSIPLAYNLDAAWTEASFSDPTEAVLSAPTYDSGVENAGAHYAFVVDWAQRNAPRALSLLWDAGYRVRSARKTITVGDKTFSRGSLVVLVGRNLERESRLPVDMKMVAAEARVRIVGFDSGRVDDGIDLASGNSRPVTRPRTALLVGDPVSSYTAGQLWFLFDQWTGFGIDRIRARRLPTVDLSAYKVLILPGGRLTSVFDSSNVARLKRWIRAGGTLVATESAATFATKNNSGMTDVRLAGSKKDGDEVETAESRDGNSSGNGKTGATKKKNPIVRTDTAAYTTYEARSDSSGLKSIPGSALRGIVDVSNPLAFGVKNEMYALKFSTNALEPSENFQTVGYYDPNPATILASGYASEKNRRKLAGKTFAGVKTMGRGRIVFLMDNMQYRMFWVGASRMVQNAVMLLPGM